MCIEEKLEYQERLIEQLMSRVEDLEKREKSEEYVTPQELAEKMGCSANNVYIKIRKGEIKAIHIGRNPKIPMSQFNIMDQDKVEAPKQKHHTKGSKEKSVKELVFG